MSYIDAMIAVLLALHAAGFFLILMVVRTIRRMNNQMNKRAKLDD